MGGFMKTSALLKGFLLTCCIVACSFTGYAQGKGGSLVRVITKETLPSKAGQFKARVVNRAKLPYPPEQLNQMMQRDRTEADEVISGRRMEGAAENLDETILKKTYEIMPPAIKPTPERQLMAAMLTSEETAKRIARNGGGKRFDMMSPEAARKTYYQRMKEFATLKKFVDIKMFYFKADGVSAISMPPHERAQMSQDVGELRIRLKFLSLYYFPEDMPLYLATKYLTQRMIALQPGLAGVLEKMPAYLRKDRVYDKQEFMLASPGKDVQRPPLPAGLKIAVVNDDPDILSAMANFGRWGRFGAGAQVTTFDSIYKLGDSLKHGSKYDIIFSDISMPNGSGMLLVNKLRENSINTPVIGLSGYKEDAVKGEDLFEIGFDGYVMSDDYGYRRAPEALQNYFYYRNLHKWMR